MKLCFDLLEKWISENYTGSISGGNSVELNITGIATYQPFDGLWELKMVFIFNVFFIYSLGGCTYLLQTFGSVMLDFKSRSESECSLICSSVVLKMILLQCLCLCLICFLCMSSEVDDTKTRL